MQHKIFHELFTLTASDGELIHASARFPREVGGAIPAIIFVHGFKGFKEWGSNPYICESLAGAGFYTISFNFTHNGVEGESDEFTQLEKFEQNTFSREVRELHEVVDAVERGQVPGADRLGGAIGLLGHSRGGGIVLLEAADDRRIGAVATWAAVSSFDRYSDRQKDLWRQAGFFESKNMRTGQMMRLGRGLLEDIETNAGKLDIRAAAARLARPLLILHGEQDLSVRIEEGEQLRDAADPSMTEFESIPRTAHTFGAVHPFQGSNPDLEHAIERTTQFFLKHLR
jgi:dienelactone hydrolase